MKKYSIFTQIAILSVILFASIQVADAQNRKVLAEAERVSGDKFAFSARTPEGSAVYGVNKPSATLLAAIDKGLTDLFAVARKNGYHKRLNYSDYSIFIA